jgi:microcystin-dependent protein
MRRLNLPSSRELLWVAAFLLAAQFSVLRADNATSDTGGGLPLDNRQPTLVTRYMIAVSGIFPDLVDGTPTQQTAPNRTDPYLGEIKPIPFNYAPNGWMLCEGQVLPIVQHQALFSLLGTTYGGNGVTTFALPDLRGRVPIGAGQGPGLPGYVLGQKVGNAAPVLSIGNLPPHAHSLPGGGSTQFTGRGAPIDNRQPALALDFMIAANGEMMIVPWPQSTTGWTRCDGRLLSSATHALLYQSIGTTHGGDATNFALPDVRGRVVLGDDGTPTGWSLGRKDGANAIVLDVADVKTHTHGTSTGPTGPAGGAGNSASNYQPSLVLRWIISFAGIYPGPTSGVEFPCVGEMRLIAGNFPAGLNAADWAFCRGGLEQIDDHDTLFSLIGTTYGGDGQLTFALPDLRGRANEQLGPGVSIGAFRGRPTLTVSLSEITPHAHLIDLRIAGIRHFSDDSAEITVVGTPGSAAHVETSDDLAMWTSLGAVPLATGSFTLTVPNPGHVAKRYFRATP